MHHVPLTDQIYEQARRRAEETGYQSVEEYVADIVATDVDDDSFDSELFFTQERISQIDLAAKQIADGQSQTADQVRDHFKIRFEK